jgi:Protein of unknown function (DUF4238)
MPAKKQHFVPQLLLRRFAVKSGDEARLNVYDFERKQYRARQNIKDVCSGNYVYDTDTSFEQFLSDHVETPAGESIELLARAQQPVDPRPTPELLRFVLVQLSRTRQSYQNSLAFTNAGMRTVFAEFARLNDLDQVAAQALRVEPSEPRAVLAYLAAYAASQWRLLSDLKLALVMNSTSSEFILADHPVFQHNWYLRDSQELGVNSITVRGLQLFLPLSPSVTCCLYDPSVYLYRDATEGRVIEASEEDVRILNSFQAINAGAVIMARSASMSATLQALGGSYADSSAFTESATYSPATIRPDGTLRSLHITQRQHTRLPAMPTFAKVKNKVRRQPTRVIHRNLDLVRAHEMYDEHLRGGNNAS